MESAFETQGRDDPILRNLPEWDLVDLKEVMHEIIIRIVKYLQKKGYLNESEEVAENPILDRLFQDHPDLTNSLSASLQDRVALGPNAGSYITRIGPGFGYREEISIIKSKLCISQNGFSIHADRVIRTQNRKGLEGLINYMARPSISIQRLTLTPTGNVRYSLKNRWNDGTEAVEFTPFDFLSRLAALVPPPRVHMVKYDGIFSPNHPLRAKVVLQPNIKKADQSRCTEEDGKNAERKKVKNSNWARLLARIFKVDIGSCRKCGADMEIISAVFDRSEVSRYLEHVGLARPPPNRSISDESTLVYLPL
jgi:hypothetical protein